MSEIIYKDSYSWRYDPGKGVSADDFGKELEKIEKEFGDVTSERLVDTARDEDSILHCMFEWDDAIAGELYRRKKATEYICSLMIVPVQSNPPKVETIEIVEVPPIRAYANQKPSDMNSVDKSGSFINIRKAFADEDTRSIVLMQAVRELQSFKRKYENYLEFSKLFNEIDSLINQFTEER